MARRIILSKSFGDEIIEPWLKTLGFEVCSPNEKMDSWINGLVIGGGLDPIGHKDPERDKRELELLKSAINQGVPCLGICRGSEIVSLWADGKLEQMNQTQLSQHQQVWHSITIDYPEIRGEFQVWSNHHLKITDTGKMKICAWSPDGLTEGVIDLNSKVLGVLWHPEKSGDESLNTIQPWLRWVYLRR